MNDSLDLRWKNLVAQSAPTFAGETTPPFGFTTAFLARLREETGQRDLIERIGLRALFVSLGVLGLTLAGVAAAEWNDRADLEPGLRNVVQVENIPLS